jgi:hypothetical protein
MRVAVVDFYTWSKVSIYKISRPQEMRHPGLSDFPIWTPKLC